MISDLCHAANILLDDERSYAAVSTIGLLILFVVSVVLIAVPIGLAIWIITNLKRLETRMEQIERLLLNRN